MGENRNEGIPRLETKVEALSRLHTSLSNLRAKLKDAKTAEERLTSLNELLEHIESAKRDSSFSNCHNSLNEISGQIKAILRYDAEFNSVIIVLDSFLKELDELLAKAVQQEKAKKMAAFLRELADHVEELDKIGIDLSKYFA